MACGACAKRAAEERARMAKQNAASEGVKATVSGSNMVERKMPATVVEASSDPSQKVKIRYYGGGSLKAAGTGCRACGGGKRYIVTTSERIMFASEDVENGLFSQLFTIGHDYYVTEKQAEYLLSLTYQNKAGKVVYKFKKV